MAVDATVAVIDKMIQSSYPTQEGLYDPQCLQNRTLKTRNMEIS